LCTNCFLKHVIEGTVEGRIDRSDGKTRKKIYGATGLPEGNERILEVTRGNTRSLFVENSLWKKL